MGKSLRGWMLGAAAVATLAAAGVGSAAAQDVRTPALEYDVCIAEFYKSHDRSGKNEALKLVTDVMATDLSPEVVRGRWQVAVQGISNGLVLGNADCLIRSSEEVALAAHLNFLKGTYWGGQVQSYTGFHLPKPAGAHTAASHRHTPHKPSVVTAPTGTTVLTVSDPDEKSDTLKQTEAAHRRAAQRLHDAAEAERKRTDTITRKTNAEMESIRKAQDARAKKNAVTCEPGHGCATAQ